MIHKILIGTVLVFIMVLPTSILAQEYTQENRHVADQGNGYYLNPIFPGNYGDPSIIRVGDDYYMAFSRSNGVGIFHSSDMVNWEPVIRQRLPLGYNPVWAVDFQYLNGKYNVYIPLCEHSRPAGRSLE